MPTALPVRAAANDTISGNAGAAGVTLSYTDGTDMTSVADDNGNYSFAVSDGWTGTVTPALNGYTFTPSSTDYAEVLSDQEGQDYTATLMATDTPTPAATETPAETPVPTGTPAATQTTPSINFNNLTRVSPNGHYAIFVSAVAYALEDE